MSEVLAHDVDAPGTQGDAVAPLRVAYLVNQYPKVSHSFIRREILALERRGVTVLRIALRGWQDVLVDPRDDAERERTRYVLQRGLAALALTALRTAAARPRRWLAAARLALAMARRSERTLFHHLAYLAEACAILRWLEAEGVDHLHAHFGTNPAEIAMLVRALGGPPYSFTVHGPEEFDKPEALGLHTTCRHAAFVVAISSFGRSQLYRWLAHADWARVKVVHCGLDAEFHRGALATAPAAPRLVCVGRLCEQKGQLLLLQALRQLRDRGIVVQLVLAGDGEMRAEIGALVDALALRSQVRITGWIGSEQVRDEIVAARALVLPSFAEGLPVVIMEAMALRRPVISTYVAGIPELVRDGDTGWLAPAGDIDALARAIELCAATSPEELVRMGECARARVLERHDIDREARKLCEHFVEARATESALARERP